MIDMQRHRFGTGSRVLIYPIAWYIKGIVGTAVELRKVYFQRLGVYFKASGSSLRTGLVSMCITKLEFHFHCSQSERHPTPEQLTHPQQRPIAQLGSARLSSDATLATKQHHNGAFVTKNQTAAS
ncbi:hypothetical protein chiPu_0007986 [Chiloscyllium punctatum]|uniref:Uncharacterized protein n=1 Tax=Chiloscyllium punctatum TaxID=137246 RepID=A0A401SGN8_CHIPU|nr:hypothetical protein [Chiloscyllium punctatum]